MQAEGNAKAQGRVLSTRDWGGNCIEIQYCTAPMPQAAKPSYIKAGTEADRVAFEAVSNSGSGTRLR